RGFLNITREVEDVVRASGVREGLCLVNSVFFSWAGRSWSPSRTAGSTLARGSRSSTASSTAGGRSGCWSRSLGSDKEVGGCEMAVRVPEDDPQPEGGGLDAVSQRGLAIYESRLKKVLEPEHNGETVAIHVESGDYAVAAG